MPTLQVTVTTDYSAQSLSNIDVIQFLTAAGATATFVGSQFGSGLISLSVTITGDAFTNTVTVNGITGTFSAAQWQFSNWTSGVDALNFFGDGSANTITGTTQSDFIDGGGGADTLYGGLGNDSLSGAGGADQLFGEDGDDNLRGGGGNDILNGGAGTDEVRYDRDAAGGGTAGVTVNLATGTATDGFGNTDTLIGIENVRGTNSADNITGDSADNSFRGLGGNDTINGGDGFDEVRYDLDAVNGGVAGVTVNLLTGTANDGFGNTDTLVSIEGIRGTNSADTLIGGLAANYATEGFRGLGGNDTIVGGEGYDELRHDQDAANGGTAGITANLSTGFVTDGFGNTDTVSGIEGVRGTMQADTFIGSDRVEFFGEGFQGLGGNDSLTGGLGFDEARYDRDATFGGLLGVVVNLATGTATDGFGNTDTLSGIENVRGTNQVDHMTGDGADNTFRGLAGNDTFIGGDGFDTIAYDLDHSNGGTSGVTVNLATGVAIDSFGNTDTFSSIEAVRGSAFADSLTGDSGRNTLVGSAGNDTIDGGDGFDEVRYDTDYLRGGANGVQVNLSTGIAIDGFGDTDTLIRIESVRGTRFADVLVGSSANETFQGLAGNDSINGGDGIDTVTYLGETFADQGPAPNGVTVNLATGTATDGFGGTDTLVSIENASGSMLADTLTGSSGANTFVGYAGNDTINGGDGTDTVDYAAEISVASSFFLTLTSGVSVNLGTGTATDAFGNTDTLVSIENANGTSFGDVLIGSSASNVLNGNGGNDTLIGGDGGDLITGGAGNDAIDGGTGNDAALWASARSNYLVRSFVSGGQFYTQVTAATGTDGVDLLANIETLGFNSGGVVLGVAGIQQNLVSNMDGSLYDDVLFQNSATGQISFQNMTAGSASGFTTILGSLPAGWRLVGSDDFTGDGRSEALVQDTNTGSIYTVNIASGTAVWGAINTGLTSSYQAIATGDVTGDGTADVLVRDNATGINFIADVDAGGTFGGWVLGPNLGTAWRTVGLGDFNRDGASDVLVQNIADGTTYYRDIINSQWGFVSGAVGSQWVAREAADINGDGYTDVIFRNSSTGDIWSVNMLGGSNAGWGVVANGLSGWDVRGSADVDNDGYRDIIIQNLADGTTYYADMNAGAFSGWGLVSGALGSQWLAVA
jgi:Ca2+-binding RTX toxin-like protein